MVYLCHHGTQNSAHRAFRRYYIPIRRMDRTAAARSNTLGSGPKYLLHDRDSKYASHFSAVATGSGIQELRTPYRAPRANGICERYMGSLRRECLNHALILNDRHLLRVVREYTRYFNQERPHQGIGQRIPDHYDRPVSSPTGNISSKAFLGGLHYSYSRVACPK